jgi:hypothetical protein
MPSLYLDETHRKISPSTDVSRKLWILSSTKMEQLRPSPSQTVQEFHKRKQGVQSRRRDCYIHDGPAAALRDIYWREGEGIANGREK